MDEYRALAEEALFFLHVPPLSRLYQDRQSRKLVLVDGSPVQFDAVHDTGFHRYVFPTQATPGELARNLRTYLEQIVPPDMNAYSVGTFSSRGTHTHDEVPGTWWLASVCFYRIRDESI